MEIQIDQHTLERAEERGKWGRDKMNILYNDKIDLLYIRLDERKQEVVNKRISEDIVLDIGKDERLIGIEILDASKHVNLKRLLPIKYETPKGVAS